MRRYGIEGLDYWFIRYKWEGMDMKVFGWNGMDGMIDEKVWMSLYGSVCIDATVWKNLYQWVCMNEYVWMSLYGWVCMSMNEYVLTNLYGWACIDESVWMSMYE